MASENYVMGRGEVHFAPFLPGTKTLPAGGGYRFLGNVPTFTLAVSSDKYEHFRSTRGVKEKDLTVILQTNRSATIECEDINTDNLQFFFLGSTATVTQATASSLTETFADIVPGRRYFVGVTGGNPTGYRGLTSPVLKKGVTVLTAGTDYVIDPVRGYFDILIGGTLVSGDDVTLEFGVASRTRQRTISGSDSVEGAMKFLSYNAVGDNIDYSMPYVKISPNGDFSLIGDELQKLPITVDVQALSPLEALYMDGQPVAGV